MSPDLTFLLILGLRMAVAAAFVVTASFITTQSESLPITTPTSGSGSLMSPHSRIVPLI